MSVSSFYIKMKFLHILKDNSSRYTSCQTGVRMSSSYELIAYNVTVFMLHLSKLLQLFL